MGESYSCESGDVIAGGRVANAVRTLVDDGVWTWFSEPRAVHRNGATYFGWVNSSGSCGISKYVHSTGVVTSFTLSSGLEVDDHNNTSIHFLTDGRIAAFYQKHNDTSGMRYRLSTSAEDISSWGSEVLLGSVTLPVSYANPHYLSATGKTYLHYRSGAGGFGTNPMNARSTTDFSSFDTERTWITNTGQRPYVKSINNGVDRIDFFLTNDHPNESATSVYHCYMQLDAGVEKFYKSDGTLIGTSSILPTDCTLIYDGSIVHSWVWDIAYGADGYPRVLFVIYPTTSDQRFMFSRWTGAAWTTPVEITNGGTYLYSPEVYYSGGLCFDQISPNIVYLSKQVGSFWEIQKWKTTDSGASWVKAADITTGSTVKNCRPVAPKNADYSLRVLWWSGTYTTYVDFNTSIKGW